MQEGGIENGTCGGLMKIRDKKSEQRNETMGGL